MVKMEEREARRGERKEGRKGKPKGYDLSNFLNAIKKLFNKLVFIKVPLLTYRTILSICIAH